MFIIELIFSSTSHLANSHEYGIAFSRSAGESFWWHEGFLTNFADNKYANNIFKCRQHQWTKILFRQLLVSQILLHFHMSNLQINPASPVWWIHFQQLQCLLSLPLTLFSLVYFHHKFSFCHFTVYLIFDYLFKLFH